MKLLLLAFAIISFLPQTTQGGLTDKKCWKDAGRCRSHCRSSEKDLFICPNKNKCCVSRVKFNQGLLEGKEPINVTESKTTPNARTLTTAAGIGKLGDNTPTAADTTAAGIVTAAITAAGTITAATTAAGTITAATTAAGTITAATTAAGTTAAAAETPTPTPEGKVATTTPAAETTPPAEESPAAPPEDYGSESREE